MDRLKKAKAEQLRNEVTQCPGRRPDLPPAETIAGALSRLRLLGDPREPASSPNDLYVNLVQAFFEVMRTGESQAVLCWPQNPPGISAIHNLAVLAMLEMGRTSEAPEPRHGLRTLYFPWNRNSGLAQRLTYVEREWLHALAIIHANHGRTAFGLDGYVRALLRIRDLKGKITDKEYKDQVLPEFMHPTLDELTLTAPADDHRVEPAGILHRVERHTHLREVKIGTTNDYMEAPFALFGMRRGVDQVRLSPSLGKIHAVILDLTEKAVLRLGPEWEAEVAERLKRVRAKFGALPVLAVASEPYVLHRLERHLLPGHHGRKAPVPVRSVFTTTDSLVAPSSSPIPNDKPDLALHAFGGEAAELAGLAGDLRRAARSLKDLGAEALMTDVVACLRRQSNLPGTLRKLQEFVRAETENQDVTTSVMGTFLVNELVLAAHDLHGPLAQQEATRVRELRERLGRLSNALGKGSGLAPMLLDVARKHLTDSSKTLLVARSDLIRDFTLDVLCSHPELGERFRARIDKGMLAVVDRIGFEQVCGDADGRKAVGTTIFLSPSKQRLLALMAEPWLPRNLIVLGDSFLIRMAARDAERLLQFSGLAPAHGRLKLLADKAAAETQARTGKVVNLEWTSPPLPEFSFVETAGTLDLRSGKASGRSLVLKTEDDHTIYVRPGTDLLLYERHAAVHKFRTKPARLIVPGDEICLTGQDFFEAARHKLDLRAAAAQEIRIYHKLIDEKFRTFGHSGMTMRERAQLVHDKLRGGRGEERGLQSVIGWLSAEKYLQEDLMEVRPHAPRDRETFLNFAGVMGIDEGPARFFWQMAVLATRSRRASAGLQFHEAVMGLLTRPYQSTDEKLRQTIALLSHMAERRTAVVSERLDHEESQ